MKRNKLIFGVGVNDADYNVIRYSLVNGKNRQTGACPIYTKWVEMLRRCYSKTYLEKRPTYKGCLVCPEWLYFSSFKRWMDTQEWQGKVLDKDILVKGNKIYSPNTCIFISPALNSFMTDSANIRGDHPIGVTWNDKLKMFRSRCNDPFTGKSNHIGYFNSANAAHLAWKRCKHYYACRYAEMETDERIANALRSRYL